MLKKTYLAHGAAVAVFLATSTSMAADPAISVGASENVGLPDVEHYGFYPYAMASLSVPAGPVVLSPGAGVEGCAELGRWGFIGAFAVDLPVHPRFGVDAALLFAHDQEGSSWADAVFSAGGGLGGSAFFDRWTLSSMVAVLGTFGQPGFVVSPSVSVGYTFDLSSEAPAPGAHVGSVK